MKFQFIKILIILLGVNTAITTVYASGKPERPSSPIPDDENLNRRRSPGVETPDDGELNESRFPGIVTPDDGETGYEGI